MSYINREKTLENLEEILNDENCPIFIAAAITQIIFEQPSEDVAPIVHSKWMCTDFYGAHYMPIVKCKHCNDEFEGDIDDKYCPCCGVKMDLE